MWDIHGQVQFLNFSLMKGAVADDLYRYVGNRSFLKFLRMFFFTPGFRYSCFFRMTGSSSGVFRFIFKFFMRRCGLKFGFQIPETTKIGRGLKFGHYGSIIINPESIIGNNLNIYPGVTIGHSNGRKFGSPIIGDNVVISANSVIVGRVFIGNDVLIAPGSFVNFDVPDGCLVIGNPGKIIHREKASSTEYVYPIV